MAPARRCTSKRPATRKRSCIGSSRGQDESDSSLSVDKGSIGSEIKLRRRDKIKTTDRYSPDLHEPSKRGRGRSGGASSFPSTTSSASKYISFESDDETNTALGNLKKKRTDLSDGTTYKVDTAPNLYDSPKKKENHKLENDSDDDIFEDDGSQEDENDKDFKPHGSSRAKKTLGRSVRQESSKIPRKSPVSAGKSRQTIDSNSNTSKLIITPKLVSADSSKSKKESPIISKPKVTLVGSAKPVTSLTSTTTSFKQPPKRNYGSAAKFIDELPELSECTNEEPDSQLARLPDRIIFINSDLPLEHCVAPEKERKSALLRQIISPVMTNFACLLCPASKSNYKDEKDLIVHYSTYHELHVEHTTAEFSDEIVFVCLPKSIISRMDELENEAVLLNAPCQYCGDSVKLATVEDMKTHYSIDHSKQIVLIEQEEILNMHKVLYCSLCEIQSPDFSTHHQHMKSKHQMHTYICKCCAFTNQDPARLRTHFRAKHMVSNTRMQNLQCTYCSGLIYGMERMNKHIMITHCVQTGPEEFSCTACLQPCGKADELLSHSYRCPSLAPGSVAKESEETKVSQENSMNTGKRLEIQCFLCEKVFTSPDKYQLHLNHVHTKWTARNVIHDTFIMVKHPNGKTDLMPSSSTGAESTLLTLNELPSAQELEEIGTKTGYGHYCLKCETVIKIYPLYYLHMYNVHKMEKVFECKISSCKQIFKESKGLEEHIKSTKHLQKSVIEDPLEAIACHFCNVYFADDKELQKHHLTDEHFNKITMLMDRSGNKPEPRNHKCKTCHSWFGLQDSFTHHLETESHRHECSYCGLHFALPSSRRTHIQSHHSEKSDICEICKEKQGSKERLFAHLVEHNIVFECNRCMRKFYQREQLNAHMETHGESLNCPWKNCTKKIMRSALNTHIRQHRIESESKCSFCGKGFSSKQVLQTHMEIHAKAESKAKAILQAIPNSHPIEKSPITKSTNNPVVTESSFNAEEVQLAGNSSGTFFILDINQLLSIADFQ
ncbi:uncharacterized protein LOC141855795 isoform X2 [Brevipalpus obovatus]|uniref:uncharacterized protein LOC141855795 isoform X2 n=1 Tax=Brevipalpus obovatus TaxID=246614 RepID=UPI003D9F76BA